MKSNMLSNTLQLIVLKEFAIGTAQSKADLMVAQLSGVAYHLAMLHMATGKDEPLDMAKEHLELLYHEHLKDLKGRFDETQKERSTDQEEHPHSPIGRP